MLKTMADAVTVTDYEMTAILAGVEANFRTFGGSSPAVRGNPIAQALSGSPLSFAAGVDVAEVVRFVIAEHQAIARRDALAEWLEQSIEELRTEYPIVDDEQLLCFIQRKTAHCKTREEVRARVKEIGKGWETIQ